MDSKHEGGSHSSVAESATDVATSTRNENASGGHALVASLLARGVREPEAYAELITKHPALRAEILGALARTLGNAALQAIMQRTAAVPDPGRTWASSEVAVTHAPQASALNAGVVNEILQRTGGSGEVDLGTNPKAPGKAAVAAQSAAAGGDPQGRVQIDGSNAHAAVEDSHNLGDMGQRLGAGMPFEQFRATAHDGEVAIEGKVNPWVRIVAGRVAEIRQGDMWESPGAEWRWVDPGVPVSLGNPLPASPPPNFNMLPPPRLQPTTRPHQTPQEYADAEDARNVDGGAAPSSLFRAVRSLPSVKNVAPSSALPQMGGSAQKVTANPDGGMFDGAGALAQQRQYHGLSAWPTSPAVGPPAPSIGAVDSTANEPVVRQVGGDNYGTQYISTSKHLAIACRATAYSWAGAGGLGNLRPPRLWGPVIQVDVRRLQTGRQRLYDLSSEGPHRDALFAEARNAETAHATDQIKGMADRDEEVLIEGAVPPEAIVRVWSVCEVLKLLVAQNPAFLDELRHQLVGDGGRVSNPRDRAILEEAGVLHRIEPQEEIEDDEPTTAASSTASSKKREERDDRDEDRDDVSFSARSAAPSRKANRGRGLSFSTARPRRVQVGDRVRIATDQATGKITDVEGDKFVITLDAGGTRTVSGGLLERI